MIIPTRMRGTPLAVLFVMLAMLVVAPPVLAQPWMPTTGPYNGFVRSMLVTPSRVLAGTTDGLYRSLDRGDQWLGTNTGYFTVESHIEALGMTSARGVVAAASKRGDGIIWRSTTSGDGWLVMTSYLGEARRFVNDGAGIVYLATTVDLWRSSNGGERWLRTGGGTGMSDLASLSSDSLLAITESRVLLSSDSGSTWRTLSTLPGMLERMEIARGGLFVLAHRNDGSSFVARSTDRGATWDTAMGLLLAGASIDALGAGEDGMAAISTPRGFFDWEGTWRLRAGVEVAPPHVRSITSDGATMVFAGTDDGVYRSNDGGTTWRQINNGINAAHPKSIAVAPSGDVFSDAGLGVYRSTDLGLTWTRADVRARTVTIAATARGVLLVATLDSLIRSTDDGVTWRVVRQGRDLFPTTFALAADSSIWALDRLAGLIHSTDDGETWRIAGDDAIVRAATLLAIGPGGHLFIARPDGAIHSSADGGRSWIPGPVFDISPITALHASRVDSLLYIGTRDSGAYRLQPTLWPSERLGPFVEQFITDLLVDPERRLVVATRWDGVHRRSLDTTDWQAMNSRIAAPFVRVIVRHPSSHLFIATMGRGVQRTEGRTSSALLEAIMPRELDLR